MSRYETVGPKKKFQFPVTQNNEIKIPDPGPMKILPIVSTCVVCIVREGFSTHKDELEHQGDLHILLRIQEHSGGRHFNFNSFMM